MKMIIKVYADWRNGEILTEAEYEQRVKAMAEDIRTSDYDFSEFLEENYSHRELWEATEEQRAKIMELWASKCVDTAYCELGYEEVELEI